jgi:enterochelin esterase family protein
MSVSALGPVVLATDLVFRLRVPSNGIRAIRLCQQIQRPRVGPALLRRPRSPVWEGRIPLPPVDRLEYQYELEHDDGTRERILDPHNDRRCSGPFGDKSVVELPGYRPPAWLRHPVPSGGRLLELAIASDVLGGRVQLGLWSSAGLDFERPAPLLIVHDGPEYDRHSDLLRFLASMVGQGRIPELRVALLAPVDRNEHYAAYPTYARALARELVPLLEWLAPQPPARGDGRSWRVAMGASLGALAALHAHRRYPNLFGGLFLQSGSFFLRHVDRQESAQPRFDRITRFVSSVTDSATSRYRIPVGMTCGTVEENLGNNRRLRDALALQGYPVALAEHRDAHNWICWRDSFDPYLTDLLTRCWSDHAA